MATLKRPLITLLLPSLLVLLCACGPAPEASDLTPAVSTRLESPTDTQSPTATLTASPSPTATLGVGVSRVSEVDGMTLLYVPAGVFTMGSEDGYPDERPAHTLTLSAFWVDRTEVTNQRYALCEAAGACRRPARKSSNVIDLYYGGKRTDEYPVIFVTWQDAVDYCTWAGRRLPTEAEWEKAARGTEALPYPWGTAAPDGTLLNFDHLNPDPVAVGSYPAGASPYGALDMAGNVMEWTADWYDEGYYALSPAEDPTGAETGRHRVVRGGSWAYNALGVTASHRFIQLPEEPRFDLGFRCVLDAAP